MANRHDRHQEQKPRYGLRLALIGFAALGAWWFLSSESQTPSPGTTPEPRPGQLTPASGPGDAAPLAADDRPGEIELDPGREAQIDLGSLVPGQALAIRLALPASAHEIGIEATWLYGEGHAPTEIQSRRARPGEVRIDFPAALLTPGRHIVELRTDEAGPIPLRRYSFEIR
ncbi:MAG TPA: hypothetical protein EYG06_01465 [Myxococcales bacterium]|nr:hypothetical protein [Myxococcales bacterium]